MKETEKDRFIQIAAGSKKMNGEVKRMAEIPPLPIKHAVLQPQNTPLGVTMSAFNEEKSYHPSWKKSRLCVHIMRRFWKITRETWWIIHSQSWISPIAKRRKKTRRILLAYSTVTVDGYAHYGDKIYGATHFGYDEPSLGWHHCPAGAGIFGKVKMVVAGASRITDIFVQPDIDKATTSVYFNGEEIASYGCKNTATGVACTYLSESSTEIPENKTGIMKVVARLENGNETTYDEVEYVVKEKMIKAQKTPMLLGDRVQAVKQVCDGSPTDSVIFADEDYFYEHRKELEDKAKDGCCLIVVTNNPLHILGEDIVFRVHTLEEEVRANNFVARSASNKFTKEFTEMDFQNFYNAKTDYQDLTAWFKFEWSGSEEILYTFEDSSDPKYVLYKKHKMIAALKKHGKGEVILTALSCLGGCLGCNPALDKLMINFIEKE